MGKERRHTVDCVAFLRLSMQLMTLLMQLVTLITIESTDALWCVYQLSFGDI